MKRETIFVLITVVLFFAFAIPAAWGYSIMMDNVYDATKPENRSDLGFGTVLVFVFVLGCCGYFAKWIGQFLEWITNKINPLPSKQ